VYKLLARSVPLLLLVLSACNGAGDPTVKGGDLDEAALTDEEGKQEEEKQSKADDLTEKVVQCVADCVAGGEDEGACKQVCDGDCRSELSSAATDDVTSAKTRSGCQCDYYLCVGNCLDLSPSDDACTKGCAAERDSCLSS